MTKKNPALLLCCVCMLAVLTVLPAGAQTAVPQPRGAVNDFAGVIDAQSARGMEQLAREVLDKTGTALVVATVTTLEGNDPADYANRLYEQWGIGRAGEDRGVLLLLALNERRVRIETGYGVEGILPDGRVGELLDRYVVPLLAQGQYGAGLRNGMAAVAQVIAADAGVTLGDGYQPRSTGRRPARRRGLGMLPLLLLLAVAGMFSRGRGGMLPFVLLMLGMGGGRGRPGGFDGFGGGFGGFGGGLSGGGGAGRGF